MESREAQVRREPGKGVKARKYFETIFKFINYKMAYNGLSNN